MIKCPKCGFEQPDPQKKPEGRWDLMMGFSILVFLLANTVGGWIFPMHKPKVAAFSLAIAIVAGFTYGVARYQHDERLYEAAQKGEDCG